ncbi:metallophosphoesterase family protein [Pirellulaceae bacterium SH501]
MFKFLHAADIHLDSPLKGLEKYEGAPVDEIRDAARKALARLVDLAIEQSVDFVVIAGDLYDGDWKHMNTGLFFVSQASRLDRAGIPLYLISGNHDAANRMTKSLNLPPNVFVFRSDAAHTMTIEPLQVALHGQSFATPSITDDLSVNYPPPKPGYFNIGILHTCVAGREGHERYAPCSLAALKRHGYDYWALGHIHQRETLCESPYIAFSGNIQGRHIRETGAKGALLVTIEQDRISKVEFQPVDVLRWECVSVDATGVESESELLHLIRTSLEKTSRLHPGMTLAVRVVVTGRTRLHESLLAHRMKWTGEIRSLGLQVSSETLWIEKVQLHTSPSSADEDRPRLSDDARQELEVLFDSLLTDSKLIQELGEDCLKRLPADLREQLSIDRSDGLAEIVAEARSRLMERLQSKEVAS